MVATAGRNWKLAPCLVALFAEADDRKPSRSHAADGSIGNAEHAARTSDHNPDDGWVTAGDVDDDNDSTDLGVDLLRAHLVASKDPRVKYLIRNGTIWKSYPNRGLPAWAPQVYTGPNAHRHHLHVSVKNEAAARNNTDPWWPTTDDDEEFDMDEAKLIEILDDRLEASRNTQNFQLVDIIKGLLGGVERSIKAHATTIRDGLAKLIKDDG